jgi:hypothetical protein
MKMERARAKPSQKRSGKTGDAKLTLFSSFSPCFPGYRMDTEQDIDTNRVTVPELDFKSPFVLEPVSTSDSSPTKMRAFLTWFDTFFSPDASHEGQAPLERDTQYVKYEEDAYRRDVPVVSAKETGNEGEGQKKGKEVSFTTGPRGKATHWKQVAFMLKEPVEVPVGEYCTRVCVSDVIGLAQVGGIVGSRHWVTSFGLDLEIDSSRASDDENEDEDEGDDGGGAVLCRACAVFGLTFVARVKRNSRVDWASFSLFFSLLGHRIEGTFHCRKSRSGNTRELDVEIHWKVLGPNEREGDVRERYDVFRVC